MLQLEPMQDEVPAPKTAPGPREDKGKAPVRAGPTSLRARRRTSVSELADELSGVSVAVESEPHAERTAARVAHRSAARTVNAEFDWPEFMPVPCKVKGERVESSEKDTIQPAFRAPPMLPAHNGVSCVALSPAGGGSSLALVGGDSEADGGAVGQSSGIALMRAVPGGAVTRSTMAFETAQGASVRDACWLNESVAVAAVDNDAIVLTWSTDEAEPALQSVWDVTRGEKHVKPLRSIATRDQFLIAGGADGAVTVSDLVAVSRAQAMSRRSGVQAGKAKLILAEHNTGKDGSTVYDERDPYDSVSCVSFHGPGTDVFGASYDSGLFVLGDRRADSAFTHFHCPTLRPLTPHLQTAAATSTCSAPSGPTTSTCTRTRSTRVACRSPSRTATASCAFSTCGGRTTRSPRRWDTTSWT